MFAELVIVGSEFSLDLLAANTSGSGIALARYTPGRLNLKNGGQWQDSPLATGRRLIDGVRGNVTDTLEVKVAGKNQNQVIQVMESLDSIIEEVDAYWMANRQAEPVYLLARMPGEDSRRYAVIYHIELSEYADPFHEPYGGTGPGFVMDGLIIGVERGPWLGSVPQSGANVASTHDQHGATAGLSIPISSRYTTDLSFITRYNGSVFSTNPLDNLFTSTYTIFYPTGSIASGWITYFGNEAPFGALVFDIGTAMAATSFSLVWEYYNGSSWATLTVSDDTNAFTNTGIRTVRWKQPYNWAETTINSNFGYIVRVRITALTGTGTNPTQQNRHVYANGRPYVEIDDSEITGDIDALSKLSLLMKATSGANTLRCNQVFAGLRTSSRGENFRAYLNVKTENNPDGITITLEDDTSIHASAPAYVAEPRSSSGFLISSQMEDTETIGEIFRITLDETIAPDYRGRYRLLIRTLAGEGNTSLRYTILMGSTLAAASFTGEKRLLTGDSFSATDDLKFQVVDLGQITIPPTDLLRPDEDFDDIHIVIEGVVGANADTQTIYINDIILLPIDEWSAESNASYAIDATVERSLIVDSIGNPKQNIRSFFRDTSPAIVGVLNRTVGGQEAVLHANTTQQLWFVLGEYISVTGISKADIEIGAFLSLQAQKRYLHLRAD